MFSGFITRKKGASGTSRKTDVSGIFLPAVKRRGSWCGFASDLGLTASAETEDFPTGSWLWKRRARSSFAKMMKNISPLSMNFIQGLVSRRLASCTRTAGLSSESRLRTSTVTAVEDHLNSRTEWRICVHLRRWHRMWDSVLFCHRLGRCVCA